MHLAGRAMFRFYYTLMSESLTYLTEIATLLRQTDKTYLEQAKSGTLEGLQFMVHAENSNREQMKENQRGQGQEIAEQDQGTQVDISNIFRTLLPRLLSRYGVMGSITIEQEDRIPLAGEGIPYEVHNARIFFKNTTDCGIQVETGTGKTPDLAKEQACRSLFIKILEKESNIPDLLWISYGAAKADIPASMKDFLQANILPPSVPAPPAATATATATAEDSPASSWIETSRPQYHKKKENTVEHWLTRERMMFR